MRKQLFTIVLLCTIVACNNETKEPASTASTPATPATETKQGPAEFADQKFAAIGKKGIDALQKGDVAAWMEGYADNAVYIWNNGDSVAGKKAISDYWTKRRGEVIDTMMFSNEIWLPIKVNQPQANEETGIWLLSWYKVNAKYNTGKSMTQWIHTAMHFNNSEKIDRVIQYLDRAPIAAAMAK